MPNTTTPEVPILFADVPKPKKRIRIPNPRYRYITNYLVQIKTERGSRFVPYVALTEATKTYNKPEFELARVYEVRLLKQKGNIEKWKTPPKL